MEILCVFSRELAIGFLTKAAIETGLRREASIFVKYGKLRKNTSRPNSGKKT